MYTQIVLRYCFLLILYITSCQGSAKFSIHHKAYTVHSDNPTQSSFATKNDDPAPIKLAEAIKSPEPLKSAEPIKSAPVKGAPIKGTSVLLTQHELEQIEREKTLDIVRLAATDKLSSEIITNRTRAYLSCESGEMVVKINFTNSFRGVAYAAYDQKASQCKWVGDGEKYHEMRIPLRGCGTKQEAPRLFINNVVLRFHRTLELEEDEIKTIICRYPLPLAPLPPEPLPPPREPGPPVPIINQPRLSELELLLIVCVLLFLALLLTGLGVSYFCLKRRNVKFERRRRLLAGPPSDISRVSVNTLEPIRIPRVALEETQSVASSGSSSAHAFSTHVQRLEKRVQHVPRLELQQLSHTLLSRQATTEQRTQQLQGKRITTSFFRRKNPRALTGSHEHLSTIETSSQRRATSSADFSTHEFEAAAEQLSMNSRWLSVDRLSMAGSSQQDAAYEYEVQSAMVCQRMSQSAQNKKLLVLRNLCQHSKSQMKTSFDSTIQNALKSERISLKLNSEESLKWMQYLDTNEQLRTSLLDCDSPDEYMNVSRDPRFRPLFSAQAWEQIVTTLSDHRLARLWSDEYSSEVYTSTSNSPDNTYNGNSAAQGRIFGGSDTIAHLSSQQYVSSRKLPMPLTSEKISMNPGYRATSQQLLSQNNTSLWTTNTSSSYSAWNSADSGLPASTQLLTTTQSQSQLNRR